MSKKRATTRWRCSFDKGKGVKSYLCKAQIHGSLFKKGLPKIYSSAHLFNVMKTQKCDSSADNSDALARKKACKKAVGTCKTAEVL